MTREGIIELARDIGLRMSVQGSYFFIGFDDLGRLLDAHAAVVLGDNPPRAMAWQDGCAFGRMAEREACAQEADAHASVEGIAQRIAAAIRARGQQ